MLKQGDRFTGKNGELCQVVAVATDLKDNSTRIVYQELSGSFGFFIASGDPVQESAPEKATQESFSAPQDVETHEIFEGEVNPDLLAFLEADTVDQKLEVLYGIKNTEDEKLLTAIEASLDITSSEGSPEDRIAFIRQTLKTRAKFEGNRLRG
ncbi:MAG: hypothetical protein J6U10_07670 [Lachnospiraceae bacterium]|nr:hypothetical protein [Lachnospiraceae bacterium]